MEHARHVFRALLVLFVLTVVLFLGRALIVPKSYGMYGPYRYDNVAEQANARAPLHGGVRSCGECHAKRLEALTKGAHKNVSCEICHGPVGRHAQAGKVVAAAAIDRSVQACGRCHRKIDGRPAGFKQVVLDQHVPGGASGNACLDCHDPHSPTP